MAEDSSSKKEENNLPSKLLVLGIAAVSILIIIILISIIFPTKSGEVTETESSVASTREDTSDNLTESTNNNSNESSNRTNPDFTVNGEEEDDSFSDDTSEEDDEGSKLPDLYIEDYYFSEDEPKQNEEFTVHIEIGNAGDSTAENFHWEWWPNDDDKECGDEIDELEAGDTVTIECDYTYEDTDEYEARVVVDPEDDVDEIDEDNNEEVIDVEPEPEEKADLVIAEYSFDPFPEKEVPFTVRIGIKNEGNKASGPFHWEWWPTYASYACRDDINELAPNSTKVVTCDYTYSGWSTYQTKAVADSDDEVDESNEGNNEYSEELVPIH